MSRRTPAYPFSSANASSSSNQPSPSPYPPPSPSSNSHTTTNPFSNSPNAVPFSASSAVDLPSHGRSSSIDSTSTAQRSLFFPNTTSDGMMRDSSSSSSNPYSSMNRSPGATEHEGGYEANGGFPASPASERNAFLPGGAGEGGKRSSFMNTSRRFLGSSSRGSTAPSIAPTISEKYSLPSDPALWGVNDVMGPEDDDYLHNPDPKRDRRSDKGGTIFTWRGLMNLGCLAFLVLGLFTLFAGYPIITAFTTTTTTTTAGFNLGGVNGSGQVPETVGNFGLIDADTPTTAYSIVSDKGDTWELVFSDEFTEDGRSFYAGDDPYWEAVSLHAWSTGDLEYYDPRMATTKNGSLVLTLDAISNHDLDYMGAHVSSWNKFCFTGGRVEAAAKLPGRADIYGLWPAFWTMGNLGRAGYGGSLDGMWPYTYDECDDLTYAGTLPNQTLNDAPAIALTSGNGYSTNYALSYLPGQRLSRCTCPDDTTHPGPKHTDGTWVGRSAPEIDVFEAQTDNAALVGQVSQSGQFAPFNPFYTWNNASFMHIVDPAVSALNTYQGGVYQQSASVVSTTNQKCYEHTLDGSEGCFAVYAFEYKTGTDGYITWFNDDKKMWTYEEGGFAADPAALVGNRKVPDEPMYIIMNLALSLNFGAISPLLDDLYPVHMSFDYVRVYQDPDLKNIGCDPTDRPTSDYIARYATGYNDPNITTWDQMTDSAALPVNKYTGTC